MNMLKFVVALGVSAAAIYFAPQIWDLVLKDVLQRGDFGGIIAFGFVLILMELAAKYIAGWNHVTDIFRLFTVFMFGYCIYRLFLLLEHGS